MPGSSRIKLQCYLELLPLLLAGQERTCANGLLFVPVLQTAVGSNPTLAAAAWHPVPAGEVLIPALVNPKDQLRCL